jgi:DNA polymerase-3 subunit gamma/tau
MWPQILEAVKNQRRFTWILLSQNAQVVGFDGTTLQIGFPNPGARDSFVSSGSEDVLLQALTNALGVQWKVEAVVDPSGGGGGGGGARGTGGPPAGGGSGPAGPAPSASYAPQTGAAPGPRTGGGPPGPQQQSGAQGARAALATAQAAPPQSASGTAAHESPKVPRPSAPPTPYGSGLEDDIPAEDDPDLDESALSGHDLIMRELGATVLEEIEHE